ncbi:MAG: sigma-54 dependent transcriptional regulator [Holosporales bacterium]|jgi:two-component system nitrogen regulation response regulator NtrX|nr:sigma-54 dependent transcriptional regulator [Holosporales bacterium]
MQSKILIIDDEPEIRRLMSEILEDDGHSTMRAGDLAEALRLAETQKPTMVFLDLWLHNDISGGINGLELLQERFPDVPVVVVSGHGTIEIALDAMHKGAYDFIEKPFVTERLLATARRACEVAQLKRENSHLRFKKRLETCLVGHSYALCNIQKLIDKVAPTNSRVFIHCPVGGGGESIALEIHEKSLRRKEPFIMANCSITNAERLDKELFGEESAGLIHAGLLERAIGGTLFLEDVTDMPLDIQTKLLRVLQNGTFTRIGGTLPISTDVRIISSTVMPQKVLHFDAGGFRQDLYYRLSIVPIDIPPLAERREDIVPLIHHFLAHADTCFGLAPRRVSDDLLSVLQAYHWPGNMRQVRNVVEWMLIMASGLDATEEIGLDFLPPEVSRSAEITMPAAHAAKLISLPFRDARSIFERDYLMAQVERFSGNISQTAEFIGMERSALHRKLKSLRVAVHRSEERKSL